MDISENTGKIAEDLEKIKNATDSINSKISSIGSIFGASLSLKTFEDLSKTLWDMDKSITAMSVQLGKGRNGARELVNTVHNLDKSLGISLNESKKLVETLAQKNYVGNIEAAAKASYLLSDATGASQSSAMDLTDTLSKVGKFSDKAMSSMYASIAKVQHANGVSKSGMEQVIRSIEKASVNMKIFGKSDEQIKAMAVSTTKLVSAFEKVGISAQTSLGWVEQLTDPTRIEENIGLYSQLGISMEEALNGGDITEQVQSGMIELGQKLKQMGPIAGAEYAKAFGVSYKEAIKAADADMGVNTGVVNENNAGKELSAEAQETRNLSSKIEHMFNKVTGVLQSFGPIAFSVLALINMGAHKLADKTKKDAKETASIFTDKVEKGIEQAKGKAEQATKEVGRKTSTMLDASNMKKVGANLEKVLSESNIGTAFSKALLGDTPKVFRKIYADTIGTISIFGKNLKIQANNYDKSMQDIVANEYNERAKRIKELENIENDPNANKLQKTTAKLAKKIEEAGQTESERYMTASQKKKLLLENSDIQNKAKAARQAYNEQQKIVVSKGEELKKIRELLKDEKLSTDQKKAYETIEKSISHELDEQADKAKDLLNTAKQQENLAKKEEKEIAKKSTDGDRVGKTEGRFGRILKSKLGTYTDEVGATHIGDGTTRGMFKGIGKKATQGLGKAGGNIVKILGKFAGPMAILGIVMKLFQPALENAKAIVQEKLKPLMDGLNPVVNELMKGLMPLIETVFLMIQPLLPLLKTVAKFLMNALSYVIGLVGKIVGGIYGIIAKFTTDKEKQNQWLEAAEKMNNIGKTMRDSINSQTDYMKESDEKKAESEKGMVTANKDGSLSFKAASEQTVTNTNSSSSVNTPKDDTIFESTADNKDQVEATKNISSNTSRTNSLLSSIEKHLKDFSDNGVKQWGYGV